MCVTSRYATSRRVEFPRNYCTATNFRISYFISRQTSAGSFPDHIERSNSFRIILSPFRLKLEWL